MAHLGQTLPLHLFLRFNLLQGKLESGVSVFRNEFKFADLFVSKRVPVIELPVFGLKELLDRFDLYQTVTDPFIGLPYLIDGIRGDAPSRSDSQTLLLEIFDGRLQIVIMALNGPH
jgi:hypothetical protein